MSVRDEFEAFVHGSSGRLLRTARLLTGDRGEAEDLLQMTLIRVARHWPAASRAPGPYAHRVLVNLSRDRARRAGRRVVEAPWDEVVSAPFEDGDRAQEMARRESVITALARLPHRQREVLVLRFYADLSVAECAGATGASEGTVKSHTSRALARMRELLADPTPLEVSPDE